VEYGWSGTTTTLIAARANVSRGAQLHHYPTKASLVLAAVTHLTERRAAEILAEAETLRGQSPEGRIGRVVDLLAASFTGPLFAAAIELWVAARTDPELRAALVPLEARIGRDMHRLAVSLLGADESRPGYARRCRQPWTFLRGLGVASLLTDDARRREELLAGWKRHSWTSCEGGVMVTVAEVSVRSGRGVGRRGPDRGRPAGRGLGIADTGRPGWTVAHQIAHLAWTDQTATLAIRDPAGFNAHLRRFWVTRPDSSTGAPRSFLAEPTGCCSPAGGPAARPSRTAWPVCRRVPRSRGTAPPCRRRPWPPARIMETWAHGLDIADALGVSRPAHARLRHVAHLGHRTFGHSFLVHGRGSARPAAYGSNSSHQTGHCGHSGRMTRPTGSVGPRSTSVCW